MKTRYKLLLAIAGLAVLGTIFTALKAAVVQPPINTNAKVASSMPSPSATSQEKSGFVSPSDKTTPTKSNTPKPAAGYFPFSLKKADCFNAAKDLHAIKLKAIDCSEPHSAQVIGLDKAWIVKNGWDPIMFKDHAKAACSDAIASLDSSWDWENDDSLQLGLVLPTRESYRQNENLVGCYLVSANKVEGSFLEPKPGLTPSPQPTN
jgi:hypothetical protein